MNGTRIFAPCIECQAMPLVIVLSTEAAYRE